VNGRARRSAEHERRTCEGDGRGRTPRAPVDVALGRPPTANAPRRLDR
jgi:hypothetical protein